MINNIKGLKTFEATQIRSYKAELDTNYTEGHSFVELLVDEVNSSFKALLRNGETYSYTFGAPGNDFIQFLIVTFRDRTSYSFSERENPLRCDSTPFRDGMIVRSVKGWLLPS